MIQRIQASSLLDPERNVDSFTRRLTLSSDQDTPEIRFEFRTGGRIEGIVMDASGQPVLQQFVAA